MSKYINLIVILAFFILALAFPNQAQAAIPQFNGHVYYVNPDGSKTNQGVPGIYLKFTDKDNHHYYAKTDANGEFIFERYTYPVPDSDNKQRQLHRTWIKPEHPEIPPIIEPIGSDKDHIAEGYTRLLSVDVWGDGLTCTYNSHTVSVVLPNGWSGEFIEGETNWTNDDGNAITHSKFITPSSIGNINFNNGNDFNGKNFVGNFYYKPNLIAGQVVNSQDNKPIQGVTVNVYSNDPNKPPRPFVTDADGRFQVAEFIGKGEIYAVRIENAPEGYKIPAKTTTLGWTKRQGVPATDPNTPLDTPSYEAQKYGDDDCAGPALTGLDAGKVGRCNFKLDPKPVITDTSTPGTPGTPGIPGSAGTGTSNPNPLNPASSLPPGVTDPNIARCINLPASGDITDISVDNKSLALSNATSLSLTLKGFAGQSNFIIPVVIKYSNNACRSFSLGFNYNPVSSSRPSPKPEDCAKATGRPDDCACTANSQCQGGKCDPNRGSICSTLPFIQTQGGDVHSNIKIEQ